jgi:hypothetical protein
MKMSIPPQPADILGDEIVIKLSVDVFIRPLKDPNVAYDLCWDSNTPGFVTTAVSNQSSTQFAALALKKAEITIIETIRNFDIPIPHETVVFEV